jgi:MFS family permease
LLRLRGGWAVTLTAAFVLLMDAFLYGTVGTLTLYSPAGPPSEEQLGLLYASYALGILVGTPVFAWVALRLGLRNSLLCGVALTALSALLFWAAAGLPLLLLARLLQGAASAVAWTSGLALVAACHAERRVEMMGYALLGNTAGSVLGPVLGGLLYEAHSYDLPFIVTGALILAEAAALLLLPADRPSGRPATAARSLLLDPTVLTLSLAVGLAAVGWGIVEPLLPIQLGQAGVSPGGIGLIFTLATIAYGISAPLVSRVAECFPIRRVMAAGMLGMAVSLPLLGLLPGAVGLAGGACLVSIAYAFMINPTSAELANAVDRHRSGSYAAAYAVYNVAYAIGMMATNAIATTAAPVLGFGETLLSVGVALVLAVPLLLLREPARLAPLPSPVPALRRPADRR